MYFESMLSIGLPARKSNGGAPRFRIRQDHGGKAGTPSGGRMTLTITNRQRVRKINVRALKEITGALLAEQAGPDAELEVNLVSPAQMAKVNETYLQHEGPTDVITFDYRDDPRGALHGELFICPEVAVQQAREFGTAWRSELARYVIHGVLHLLGHDDLKPVARRKMKRVENRLLQEMESRFALRRI